MSSPIEGMVDAACGVTPAERARWHRAAEKKRHADAAREQREAAFRQRIRALFESGKATPEAWEEMAMVVGIMCTPELEVVIPEITRLLEETAHDPSRMDCCEYRRNARR